MKRWYQWLYLSLAFAFGGFLNYLNGKQILASVLQVSLTAILALVQFLCDKNGERGKKTFQVISAIIAVLLVIWLIFLLSGLFS